jgi:hypothetical protein
MSEDETQQHDEAKGFLHAPQRTFCSFSIGLDSTLRKLVKWEETAA